MVATRELSGEFDGDPRGDMTGDATVARRCGSTGESQSVGPCVPKKPHTHTHKHMQHMQQKGTATFVQPQQLLQEIQFVHDDAQQRAVVLRTDTTHTVNRLRMQTNRAVSAVGFEIWGEKV